jgi:hypothetical protein
MLTRNIITVLSLKPTSLSRRVLVLPYMALAALASTVSLRDPLVVLALAPHTPYTSAHMRGRMCGALTPIVSGCHSSTHRYNIFIVGPVS